MTTYVTRKIYLAVSEKQNGTDLLIKRGESEIKFNAVSDLDETRSERYVLTGPVTDKDLMEGSSISAGKILILETDTEILVKLETTSDTGITVKPVVADDSDTKRGTLYLEGNFDHLYVSFTGTDDATILIGIIGV